MRRVLITGGNGLLGQKLTDLYLRDKDVQLLATGRGPNRHPQQEGYAYEQLDISNRSRVVNLFDQFRPEAVIHGAAMTHVDQCELDPAACHLHNVLATEHLVDAASKVGAHFIFVSTDFIFNGQAGPYSEEDEPDPLSVYGRSKLEAELYVQGMTGKWAIARTVLVYGMLSDQQRGNIVTWAKGALESGKAVQVVDDQVRSPTLAEDLALGCYLLELKGKQGIYNISGKDQMSVYELVQRVAAFYGLSMENVRKTDSASLAQAAKRPPVTGFDLSKSRRELGYEPHSFEEGLALMEEQLKKGTMY